MFLPNIGNLYDTKYVKKTSYNFIFLLLIEVYNNNKDILLHFNFFINIQIKVEFICLLLINILSIYYLVYIMHILNTLNKQQSKLYLHTFESD